MNGEHKSGDVPSKLLTEAEFRQLLGGVSERKFHELRATGVIPPPLALGPRVGRWTIADFEAVVQRLPRRDVRIEPPTLAEGRRARIERIKSGRVA